MVENMNYLKFEIVCQQVSEIVGSTITTKELVPDRLVETMRKNNISFNIHSIADWSQFEAGKLDFDFDKLSKLMHKVGIKDDYLLEDVIIVTDAFFQDQMAIKIAGRELRNFVESGFSNVYNQEFFQPQDYIFIFTHSNALFIIHHEGILISSCHSPEN